MGWQGNRGMRAFSSHLIQVIFKLIKNQVISRVISLRKGNKLTTNQI